MTDLLTTDHADSGEVVRLNLSIVDTHRLDLGGFRDAGQAPQAFPPVTASGPPRPGLISPFQAPPLG